MPVIKDWDFCVSNNTLLYARRPTVGSIRIRGQVFGRPLTRDGTYVTTSVVTHIHHREDGVLEATTSSGEVYQLEDVCPQYASIVPKYLGVIQRKETRDKLVEKYGVEFVAALGEKVDRDVAAEFGMAPSTVTRIRNKLHIQSCIVRDATSDRRRDARVVVVFPEGLDSVNEGEAVEMFIQALNKARDGVRG